MSTLDRLAGAALWVSAVTGALVALAWLIPRIRAAFRALDAVETIVTRELTHNHGSSIKDDSVGTAVAVQHANRRLDALEDRVAAVEATITRSTQ